MQTAEEFISKETVTWLSFNWDASLHLEMNDRFSCRGLQISNEEKYL